MTDETITRKLSTSTTYAITATVTREGVGWQQSRQIPAFYLDSNVQGIVSEEHAQKVAMAIIDPFDTCQVFVTAVAM